MEQLDGRVLELERQVADLRAQLRRLASNAPGHSFGSTARPIADGYLQARSDAGTYRVRVAVTGGTPAWSFERVR